MNIAILVSDFPPNKIGGTEIQSYLLAKELAKKHKVTVITRHYDGLPSEEERDGFLIKRFRCINLPVIRFLSHIIFSLFLIRKEKLDILQCMMLTPNGFIGVLSRKLFRTKAISWVRGGDWYLTRKSIIGSRIISYVIRNSPLILTQTEKTRKDILKEFPEKVIKAIPNGVEIKKKVSSGDKILFVGNLIQRKGVKYLIQAMKDTNSELLIIGDGPERPHLESIAGCNVSFIGQIPHRNIDKYLIQGRVFVLPSIEGEGLPNAILEAMSYGLPVIASNIAGIPDVVEHGITGFLVEPGKSDQIKKYLTRLLKDEKLRKKISKNCLKKANNHSWDNVINLLEKTYQGVV